MKLTSQLWSTFGLLTSILCALHSSVMAETYSPQVGKQHVPFTLPAIDDGRAISLEQFRGKKILLIQFASW